MSGVAIVDTNLMVLLIVGTASRTYISKHKRLEHYTAEHFDYLGLLLAEFSDIVILPHILAETSSIVRQFKNPALTEVQSTFKEFIETLPELAIGSIAGAQRDEFDEFGLTDAVILHLCNMNVAGISPTLITADSRLANRASALGYSIIDFRQDFQGG